MSMYLTQNELQEVREEVHRELAVIHQMTQETGSYNYLCWVNDGLIFTHAPVGQVIHKV